MGVNHLYGVIFLAFVSVAGCTKHNPAVCEADSDCTDAARPFCDVNGEYSESNHTPGECTVTPANCPVSRCGCTPGETLACSNGTATVCGADGLSSKDVACSLGCSTNAVRCASFEPSNGLGPAFVEAAGEADVVLPPGVHIDTDLGTIQSSSGNSISVRTTVVEQPGGHASIRVFEGKSFSVSDATVSGTNSLAFVSPGAITIQGDLDLSGKAAVGGPGAQESPASCAGTTGQEFTCSGGLGLVESNGGGGAGNATPGGTGGEVNGASPGGAADPNFVPLVGGCRGGDVQVYLQSTILTRGGAGGGALQLVSLDSVTIRGLINLGGGGGTATMNEAGGGGSGGMLIIEAPVATLQGPGGVVANGGAGGGCGMPGANGTQTSSAAVNSGCSGAGAGGTTTTQPTNAYSCLNNGNVVCVCSGYFSGGGGAVGRLRVVTTNAGVTSISNPLVSAQVNTATLQIQ